jgi:hypothetical protein
MVDLWKGLYVPIAQGVHGAKPVDDEVPGVQVAAHEEEDTAPAAGV